MIFLPHKLNNPILIDHILSWYLFTFYCAIMPDKAQALRYSLAVRMANQCLHVTEG